MICPNCNKEKGRTLYYANYQDGAKLTSVSRLSYCSSECALKAFPDTPYYDVHIANLMKGEQLRLTATSNMTTGHFPAGTIVEFDRMYYDEYGVINYDVNLMVDSMKVEFSILPDYVRLASEEDDNV